LKASGAKTGVISENRANIANSRAAGYLATAFSADLGLRLRSWRLRKSDEISASRKKKAAIGGGDGPALDTRKIRGLKSGAAAMKAE